MGHAFWWWWRRWLLLSCLMGMDLDDKSRPPVTDESKIVQNEQKMKNNVLITSKCVLDGLIKTYMMLCIVYRMLSVVVWTCDLGRTKWNLAKGLVTLENGRVGVYGKQHLSRSSRPRASGANLNIAHRYGHIARLLAPPVSLHHSLQSQTSSQQRPSVSLHSYIYTLNIQDISFAPETPLKPSHRRNPTSSDTPHQFEAPHTPTTTSTNHSTVQKPALPPAFTSS